MNANNIGKFIKTQRTEKGLSQYQLADIIPISRQAVSKWERGQTIPDSSTLLRLSDIFDVTINELLLGKKLENNQMKELEGTTLSLLDESNKKTKKIKRIIFFFSTLIFILLLIFLFYYFVNSYKSIKIYKLNAESDNFIIYDGLFISTGQKTYLKIGKIKTEDNIEINKIIFYYKDGNKKIIMNKDVDIDKTHTYQPGYTNIFLNKTLDKILKSSYIEIIYNETEKEIIKIKFNRDFTNNKLFFLRKRISLNDSAKNSISEIENNLAGMASENKEKEEKIKEKSNQIVNFKLPKEVEETIEERNIVVDEAEKIEFIKQLGIENAGSYVYEVMDDGIQYSFTYIQFINQMVMYKNGEVIWSYMHFPQIYHCEILDDKTLDASDELVCKKYILECMYKYLK